MRGRGIEMREAVRALAEPDPCGPPEPLHRPGPSEPIRAPQPRPLPEAGRPIFRDPVRRFQPLVVEDDAAHAALLERAFEKAGLRLALPVLSDGETAVAYLKGEGRYAERDRFPLPSLLLLDLFLPGLSGLELTRWIRTQSRSPHLPIVILTSCWSEDGLRRAYHAGANSFLVKPSTFEELVTVARTIGAYWSLLNQPERH